MVNTYKGKDQPGKVANPARVQLNRANDFFPVTVCAENFVSRDGFGSPVPRQPAYLHTQAESVAYLPNMLQPRRSIWRCMVQEVPANKFDIMIVPTEGSRMIV